MTALPTWKVTQTPDRSPVVARLMTATGATTFAAAFDAAAAAYLAPPPVADPLPREPAPVPAVAHGGAALREARTSRRLSLAAVGRMFDVDHATVKRWEVGAYPVPDAVAAWVRGEEVAT